MEIFTQWCSKRNYVLGFRKIDTKFTRCREQQENNFSTGWGGQKNKYYRDNDDEKDRIENEDNSLIFQNDEIDLDLIVEEFGVHEQISQGVNLGNNFVGCLNSKMKDIHIISSTIHQKSSVILNQEKRSVFPETEIGGIQVTQPVGYVGTLLAIRINESTAEWTARDCYV